MEPGRAGLSLPRFRGRARQGPRQRVTRGGRELGQARDRPHLCRVPPGLRALTFLRNPVLHGFARNASSVRVGGGVGDG